MIIQEDLAILIFSKLKPELKINIRDSKNMFLYHPKLFVDVLSFATTCKTYWKTFKRNCCAVNTIPPEMRTIVINKNNFIKFCEINYCELKTLFICKCPIEIENNRFKSDLENDIQTELETDNEIFGKSVIMRPIMSYSFKNFHDKPTVWTRTKLKSNEYQEYHCMCYGYRIAQLILPSKIKSLSIGSINFLDVTKKRNIRIVAQNFGRVLFSNNNHKIRIKKLLYKFESKKDDIDEHIDTQPEIENEDVDLYNKDDIFYVKSDKLTNIETELTNEDN